LESSLTTHLSDETSALQPRPRPAAAAAVSPRPALFAAAVLLQAAPWLLLL
jgi:hypothetical protein